MSGRKRNADLQLYAGVCVVLSMLTTATRAMLPASYSTIFALVMYKVELLEFVTLPRG